MIISKLSLLLIFLLHFSSLGNCKTRNGNLANLEDWIRKDLLPSTASKLGFTLRSDFKFNIREIGPKDLEAEMERQLSEKDLNNPLKTQKQNMETFAKVLVQLGVLQKSQDYIPVIKTFHAQSPLAIYLYDKKEIWIPKETLIKNRAELKPIFVHELVHLLQDMQFDLRAQYKKTQTSEEYDSLFAMIEAEATFVQKLVEANIPLDAFGNKQLMDMRLAISAEDVLSSDDPIGLFEEDSFLKQNSSLAYFLFWSQQDQYRAYQLILAYALGFSQTAPPGVSEKQIATKVWEYLRPKVFQFPLRSMEQILHVTKNEEYGTNTFDSATKIPDDLSQKTLPKGWRIEATNVTGESFWKNLFRALSHDKKGSQSAASGWDGDRYWLLTNAEKSVVISKMIFDRENDAADFIAFAESYIGRTRNIAVKISGTNMVLAISEKTNKAQLEKFLPLLD